MGKEKYTKKFLHNCLSNAAASTGDKSVTALYAEKRHC